MSLPTYVSAGFKRNLKSEFPHLKLEWDEERERWALWEIDRRGWRWFDRHIQTPEGEPREPGDWLLALLRAAKIENQGVYNVADRKAWIKKLYPDIQPWVCDTCMYTELDVHSAPGCNLVVIDSKHRRWCRACLVKNGWHEGMPPIYQNAELKGLMRKPDAEREARGQNLSDRAKSHARVHMVFPAAHTTDFKGPLILPESTTDQ